MLSAENFTVKHIAEIKENRRIDPSILERSIYALGLLETLVKVKMPFIFKGGTSLMLLADSPRRLSTDIDIIVSPGTDIRKYLAEAAKIYPFKEVNEDIRKAKGRIVKAHYRFAFYSERVGKDLEILLDVLYEDNHYSKLVEREIKTDILITEEPYLKVTMPSADCILGDKLTAFAPHTTGIPLGIDKELEIMKQMFDVVTLAEMMSDFEDVYQSYMNTVASELEYRGLNATAFDVLNDTIDTSICIAARGNVNPLEYEAYKEGIKGLLTHIFDEPFSGEKAAEMACRVIYIAVCILTGTSPNNTVEVEKYLTTNLGNTRFAKLSYLRKVRPEAFAYVAMADELLVL